MNCTTATATAATAAAVAIATIITTAIKYNQYDIFEIIDAYLTRFDYNNTSYPTHLY